ncbi:structural maintenance of chromosomes protein 1A-like isoform X1 [Clavelina lepadiformis]|uniref:structural maintenance of chromosomes protein 1A-like isoform X1 n=1 Tax=Clavelina lepadiformis TaxID=159417 RepID=UPI004042FCB0
MSGFLECIEVENFKSYRGKILIPFKRFTAIIGPNGSGKSNLMDAISFVLGEKTSSLRVKKLSELIHGAPINRPVANRARVSATYRNEDGEKTEFSRIIKSSSAEHRINDKVVSHAEYTKEMEKINIFIKVKNFLVFQGQVESIAMKNPKERTHLFEEISGSAEFKEDYDKAKIEMSKSEQETQYSYHRKKGIAAERKEAKQEKDEAEKYRKLHEDYANSRLQLMLFKFFYNDKDIDRVKNEIDSKSRDIRHHSKKKERYEEEIKKKKQEQGKLMRELSALEKKIQEKESELNKKRPLYIKAKENTNFVMKKLESARKSLKTSESRHESHMQVIEDLKKQLQEIDEKRSEYDGEMEKISLTQGRDFELEECQIREYNQLKEEAAKRSTAINTEIEKLQREQQNDQEKLDAEKRKRGELVAQKRQKDKELEESTTRVTKLKDYIETSRKTLAEHKKLKEQLEQQVQESFERIRQINIELEEVMRTQGDAKVDRTESSRQKRRVELLETLRRLFPGVYGRVLDLCEPVHNRYKIAITKVLGKYMNAVICDTEKTARDCIQYMKEQCAEPETFLPLDYIEAKPVNEQLREIKEPRGVRLVIDVIKYELPAIKRALQFTCGNSLVCESADDARKVAFGQVQVRQKEYQEAAMRRNQAVALDGTLFQKSGVISGGTMDLMKKAQRWDQKELDKLQTKKEKLTEDLKKQMKQKRKEADLKNVISQIGGLENRIKYSQNDLDNTENRNERDFIQKITQLEMELQNFEPRFMEIEERMTERSQEINNYKESMNEVEDQVFGTFCNQIGVTNIRVYEERELRRQQEMLKKRLEFDTQKSRITNQLEYENSLDTEQNVLKWREMIRNDETNIEKHKREERKAIKMIQETEDELQEFKTSKIDKRRKCDDKSTEVDEIRKELGKLNKEVSQFQKLITSQELKLDQKRELKHSLLQQCKMGDISLPMKKGSAMDMDQSDVTSEQSSLGLSQSTNVVYEREANMEIEYKKLSQDLKNLDVDEVKRESDRLQSRMNDLSTTIQRIAAPNMKAVIHLDEVKTRYHESKDEFDSVRKRAKKSKQDFEIVKKKRFEHFNQCFDYVATKIDDIYKELSRNNSAQAFLGPENPEEPYLEGTTYNCVAPGKRFRPMDNLSGGEKTVAALALVFAIHDYQPSPFFVLDEIDAALDNTNIGKVAEYIKEMSKKVQCIVISLKEEFYNKVDALVGIYPEQVDGCIASKVVTLDLTCYPEVGDATTAI